MSQCLWIGKTQKLLEWLIALSVFVLLILHIGFRILCYDIWWYLRAGQFILEHHTIPQVDIYSFTAFGQPWMNHHWLAEIIYTLTYRWAGFSGLLLFKASLITLTFFILYQTLMMVAGKKYIALIATVFTFLCSSMRFMLRAETISYFILSLFLFILVSYKYKRKDRLWILPLLVIIGVNTHASALAGCAILFLFALGEYLRLKTARYFSQDQDAILQGPDIKRLWFYFLLVSLASLVNPHGYRLHLFCFQMQGPAMTAIMPLQGVLQENIAPNILSGSKYSIFFFVTLLSLLGNPKKLDLTYLALFVLGFSVFQLAIRHAELFAILSCCFLAHNLKHIVEYLKPLVMKIRILANPYARLVIQVIILIILVLFSVRHRCDRHLLALKEAGPHRGRYPVGAVSFIKENHIRGRMFNSYGFGGFLIWSLYPDELVFIDGRLIQYLNNNVYEDYEAAYRLPVGQNQWKDIFAKYDIDYTVVYYSLSTNKHHLYENLYRDRDWRLVYWDDISLVYVKNVPKFKDLIRKFEYKKVNPIDPTFRGIETDRDYEELIEEYKRKTQEDPESFLAYERLGIIYEKQGNLKEAEHYFEKDVSLAPFASASHFNLGLVKQKLGLWDEATQEFKLALRYDPKHFKAFIQLGLIQFIKGNYPAAIGQFKKAIRAHQDQARGIELAYLYLGASYHNIGSYQKAKDMYNKAKAYALTREEARKNLEQLASKGLI
ncbi:MAG: tetratricopeptide repeat protein [Candidatus Omnitrophota bacterium]